MSQKTPINYFKICGRIEKERPYSSKGCIKQIGKIGGSMRSGNVIINNLTVDRKLSATTPTLS